MTLTQEQKDYIDEMTYIEMLRLWRTVPAGDPLFVGETGIYFGKIIAEKRIQVGPEEHTAASKSIGWGE
jgi:hypothetical protein